jgi:hypothetical protein
LERQKSLLLGNPTLVRSENIPLKCIHEIFIPLADDLTIPKKEPGTETEFHRKNAQISKCFSVADARASQNDIEIRHSGSVMQLYVAAMLRLAL